MYTIRNVKIPKGKNNVPNFVRMTDITGNIKRLLEESQRPNSWLADKAGITRGGLFKMMEANSFRSDTLEAIAAALEVPVSVLFGEKSENKEGQNEKAFYQTLRISARALAMLTDTVSALNSLRDFEHETPDDVLELCETLSEAITEDIAKLIQMVSELDPTYNPESLLAKYGSEGAKAMLEVMKQAEKAEKS